MFGLRLRFWINGSEIIFLASKNSGLIINFLFLNVIPTRNLLFFFLLKRKQFLKFNSSINFYFIGSPRNQGSTCINGVNCSWSTKSPYSRAALFTFLFIYLNESRIWSWLFLEEILVVLMRISIFSIPHSYYHLELFFYSYIFQYLPLHYCFPSFTHLQFQRDFFCYTYGF